MEGEQKANDCCLACVHASFQSTFTRSVLTAMTSSPQPACELSLESNFEWTPHAPDDHEAAASRHPALRAGKSDDGEGKCGEGQGPPA